MAWILMQTANNADSLCATKLRLKTGKCLFDLSLDGTRLLPIGFGSRACNEQEKYLHSFVEKTACGRWEVGQNRRYL